MTAILPELGIMIQNDSGMEIPPRSIVVVTSVEIVPTGPDQETIAIHHVKQFDVGVAGNIFVTGPVSIPVPTGPASIIELIGRSLGTAYSDQLIYVAIDPTVLAPLPGEQWGPVPGEWTVGRGGIGFFAQGYVDNVNEKAKRAIFNREQGYSWGKIVSGLSAGTLETPTTCLVDVWTPDPNSSADPLPYIKSTNPDLLGLTVTNRGCWTASSSSSSGSSSGSNAIPCRLGYEYGKWYLIQVLRCTTVVTDVSCSGGSLSVTKGTIQG